MRHYAYTNAKLNSPLQQNGNDIMPTIEWTPLKTVTANKVDSTAAGNAIAMSIGKKSDKKKKKTTKEKKIRLQQTARRDLIYNVKFPKIIY
jgi:hypothetical protein